MNQDISQFANSSVPCPLCDEEISLYVPVHRVSAKWHDAFDQRDKWVEVAEQFRIHQSIEGAAQALSITPALTEYLLQFLCTEICGCRTVTCVSCLDDYRSVL
jgi:hypothetical protein